MKRIKTLFPALLALLLVCGVLAYCPDKPSFHKKLRLFGNP